MLAQFRSSLSYANVIATVAVFVALGGTSYAVATGSIDSREIKNNTVRSKDIRNNDVTTRDFRNNSARGADVRNDSLTGDDVLESSLGTVPRANSANSADSATSASTASNASALGGLGPDAFLRSDRATLRAPVSVDDPAGGNPTSTPLITAGPVTLYGQCSDNGALRSAFIRAQTSTTGIRYSAIRATATGPGNVSVQDAELETVSDLTVLEASSGAPLSLTNTFALHDPASATYRSGTMWASVNTFGDCAFAITAFG